MEGRDPHAVMEVALLQMMKRMNKHSIGNNDVVTMVASFGVMEEREKKKG